MTNITEKEVEHIAELARIKLSDKDKSKLTKELGAILGYIDKLKEVNTDNVESVAHITGLENVFRKDGEPQRLGAEQLEQLVNQAPETKGGYVKVKSVFGD